MESDLRAAIDGQKKVLEDAVSRIKELAAKQKVADTTEAESKAMADEINALTATLKGVLDDPANFPSNTI